MIFCRFLKCERGSNGCQLIFYGKSRIKSIIFLSIDLQTTNQKEIFDEMNNNIVELQNINRNLVSQLKLTKNMLQSKDNEIVQVCNSNKQLENRFVNDLQTLTYVFSTKLQECSTKLLTRILVLTQRLLKLVQDVEIIKTEAVLRANSGARLAQTLENLRVECVQHGLIINELKEENCNLKSAQLNYERNLTDLNNLIRNKEQEFSKLQEKKVSNLCISKKKNYIKSMFRMN